MTQQALLTEDEAARRLGDMPPATLRQWRYVGKGPAYVKIGRHVRYRADDLDRWIAGRVIDPSAA